MESSAPIRTSTENHLLLILPVQSHLHLMLPIQRVFCIQQDQYRELSAPNSTSVKSFVSNSISIESLHQIILVQRVVYTKQHQYRQFSTPNSISIHIILNTSISLFCSPVQTLFSDKSVTRFTTILSTLHFDYESNELLLQAQ